MQFMKRMGEALIRKDQHLQHHEPKRSALVTEPCYKPKKKGGLENKDVTIDIPQLSAKERKRLKKNRAKKAKGIHFGAVHVREYAREIGESVSGGGPAVGLGWDVQTEKKYKTLESHEKNVIMSRYRDRGQLGRLPPRQQDGIIEFQSLQDEYWIPPNKRHHLLLMAGVKQSQVLESVKNLDKLRAQRKISNGDKDALCFALALHHNMTEEEVMVRLSPPSVSQHQQSGPPPGMSDAMPKSVSLQAKIMIAMKLKSKARKAIRAVALKSRMRRSSIVKTQQRGLRTKLGSHEDLSSVAESATTEVEQLQQQQQQQTSIHRRGRKNRRTSTVQLKTDKGETYYYDDPTLGGTGDSAWDMEELEQLLGIRKLEEEEAPTVVQEDEDVEVIKLAASPNQRKKKKVRRSSVVAIEQDDGSKYYYDDPSLGGTGATAWQRDELEVLTEEEEEEEDGDEDDGDEDGAEDGEGGGVKEEEKEEEEPAVVEQVTIKRKPRKKTKRSSVVAIEQENGPKYYYDDPSLGGTGATAWLRDELEALIEKEDDEEEDDESDTNDEEKTTTVVRKRRKSATAKNCTVDGCKVSHRNEDGRCHLHR